MQRGSLEAPAGSEDKRLMLVDVGDTVIVTTKEVDNPLRLVILDTGITSSLSEKDRENFRSVFTAVVKGEVSGEWTDEWTVDIRQVSGQ